MRPFFQLGFRDRHADAPGYRLRDRTPVRRVKRAIDFAELECRRYTIADSDRLIGRRDWYARRGRRMIEPVAPAKAAKPAASLLKKSDNLRQRLECLHAITGIVAPA